MKSVRILADGRWAEHEVRASSVRSTRKILPAVEAAIDLAWKAATAVPDVRLFDGPVCRLESFTAAGDALTLALSETSYRINVGTNFRNPQLADEFGPEVMANPVGVSAGVISREGFLILGRRNGSVACYPHRLHPFAGSLEVRPAINVFDDVRRELREELGFTPADIASIECVGIAEDLALRHPELLFIVRSFRTRDEIQSRVDPDEHGSSEAFAVASLDAALRRDGVTPIGRAVARRCIDVLAPSLP